MIDPIIERICMNPECRDNIYLNKCPDDRPIIRLGKMCWNCGKDEFLEKK